MIMAIAADVNRVAVIGEVPAEFLPTLLHQFLIAHISHRQVGDKTGMDSAAPPAPRDIPDLQFDGFRWAASERLLAGIVVGAVAVERAVGKIGTHGFKLADGFPFRRQTSVKCLLKDEKAMELGIPPFGLFSYLVDEHPHEGLGFFNRIKNAEFFLVRLV